MSQTSTITVSSAARPYTTVEQAAEAHDRLVKTFASGKTKSLRWRKWQLKQFWWMVTDNEDAICRALAADLGRPDMETLVVECTVMKQLILDQIEHLEEWAADDPIPEADFIFRTIGKARIRKEPRGVALVLGAWNTPVLVTFAPAVAAVAAGCCVLMKPSELPVASQNLMADLVKTYLDPEAIQLVTGGAVETSKLLELKFDHIFHTGSVKVGKIVLTAAAKHMTPVVLELGGQGPAIVTGSVDPNIAAKRIAWAKYMNAGQICTCVNHVFVDPSIHDQFVERLVYWTAKFAGEGDLQVSNIINKANYNRLSGLLANTKGKVHQSHKSNEATNTFAPAVVSDVKPQDALLNEEIFGPICPVIKATYREAVEDINSRPNPLAAYIFSNDRSEINYILDNTLSGGVTVNDLMMHGILPGTPFGGVGESGMGAYHGKYGFLAFTHLRAVVEIPFWLDSLMAWRYPPYDIKNKGNVAVKNKLGFRRGETMEDQVIGRGSFPSWTTIGVAVAVAGTLGAQWSRGGLGPLDGVISSLQSAVRGAVKM